VVSTDDEEEDDVCLCVCRCALKIEASAQKCVNVLLELIQTKVSYVVQEAIVVIRDIFRKYPNR
jgi:vesicle coat complex subunit